MDTSAPWRAVEMTEGASGGAGRTAEGPGLAGHRLLLLAAVIAAVGTVVAAVAMQSAGGGEVAVLQTADPTVAAAATPALLVVDVTGAVLHPGVYSLPAGSRVADAIQAAGGYSPDVDPRQAETQLNLAAKIADAQLIHVPRRGEEGSPAASGGAGTSGGLVNLNTATAQELDTLPGVGPATAAKIIAAREQQPFKSVDDLVTRKVVTAATLAKLRSLVTV